MDGRLEPAHPADPAAEDRVATWALALLAGQVHQVITDLKHQAGTLPDDQRNGINATIGYLTNNTDHLSSGLFPTV